MTRSLYELHSELYALMKEFEPSAWAWYKQPDCWVPHCTVALTSEDEENVFYEASKLVLHEYKKPEGVYTSVGLVKISFPVEELKTFDFER